MSALAETVIESIANPFKFLNFFTENDSAIFAGRDAETRAVLAGISAGQTFVLYGPSGVGKSSLLLADVIPRLHVRGYRTVYLRVLDQPVGDLVAAVNEQLKLSATEHTLPEELRDASSARPLIIVFDQFEEFFIRFEQQKSLQREFGALLRRVFELSDMAVQVVFSLREDYFAGMGDLKNDLPDLFAQSYRLLHLTAFGSRQAIIAPLIAADMTYDAELITLMVDDLAAVNFDPPILQILCTEIFKASQVRDPATRHLVTADFYAVGGTHEIFPAYVRKATQVPDDVQRLIIYSVLDVLTTERGTKMAMRLGQLLGEEATEASVYFKASREELLSVMQHLEEKSIVRRLNTETYELLHDRLVRVVKKAIEQDAQFNRFRNAKRFVSEFTRALWSPEDCEKRGFAQGTAGQLMSVQQLEDLVRPYEPVLRLTAAEIEFVLRSHIAGQTEQIGEWAGALDRFPTGDSESVICSALASRDDRVRAGAAFAVRQLLSPSASTIGAVVGLALTDPSEAVRRRAGETLSQHSGDIIPERVRNSLGTRAYRSNALDLLCDLAASEKTLPGIGIVNEVRVAARLRKRVFYEARDAIRKGAAVGAIGGAIAGAVWIFTIGISMSVVAFSIRRPLAVTQPSRRVVFDWISRGILFVVGSILAALLVGWRAGVRVEKRKALHARADWLFQPVGGIVQLLFVILTAFAVLGSMEGLYVDVPRGQPSREVLTLVLSFLPFLGIIVAVRRATFARHEQLISGSSAHRRLVIGAKPFLAVAVFTATLYAITRWIKEPEAFTVFTSAILAAGLAVVAAGKLADWTTRCLDRASSAAAVGGWSFACAGLAPLAPLLVIHAWIRFGDGSIRSFLTQSRLNRLVGHAVVVMSITAFAASVVCAWLFVRRGGSKPTAHAHRTRWPRIAAATAGVVTVGLAAILFLGDVPFFKYEPLAAGQRLLHDGVVDSVRPTAYHGVEVTEKGPALIGIEYDSGAGVEFAVAGRERSSESDVFLAFARQHILFAATQGSNHYDYEEEYARRFGRRAWKSAALPRGSYRMTATSYPIVSREPGLQHGQGQVYALYTLKRNGAQETFRGAITAVINVDARKPRSRVDVRVIAIGNGQERSNWFSAQEASVFLGAEDELAMMTDTVATDTVATDTAAVSEAVAQVESTASIPPNGISRYVHPLATPWSIRGQELVSIPVQSRLSVPLTINRTVLLKRGEATGPTPWWHTTPDSITALVELHLRVTTNQELLNEGARLLQESWTSNAKPRLRQQAIERFGDVLRQPGGAKAAVDYTTGLLESNRLNDAYWVSWGLLQADPHQAELWDVLAHAAATAHEPDIARKGWDQAEKLGFSFVSKRCTDSDRALRASVTRLTVTSH